MPSTCQYFIFLWPKFLLQRTVMVGKGWSPTTNQHTAFAFSSLPASSLSHLLHPQPRPIKGLCVVPPAPIEVGTTNYPFIPAVVPSAQHRSPCPPPTLSKFNGKKNYPPPPPRKTVHLLWLSSPPHFLPFLGILPVLTGKHSQWKRSAVVGRITQEPASIQTAAPAPQATNKDFVSPPSPFTC